MKLGEPDLETLLRLEGTSAAPSDSPFTINYLSDNLAAVSWLDFHPSSFYLQPFERFP
jgi:hypothetical protein